MKETVQSFSQSFFNLVFPPECPYCEKQVTDNSPDQMKSRFCDSCIEHISPAFSEKCSICDAPVGPHSPTEKGCYYCHRDHFHFDQVKSLGVYSEELRNICLRAKESSGRPLVAAALNLFWEIRGAELSQNQYDLIIPIPFHWRDRLNRSHFPPETIAKEISKKLKRKCNLNILKKNHKTEKQSSLPASRRRSNVRNSFRVRMHHAVAGKSILLVDDILTTGSTANEASRCLKKAGAKRISVVVLARALGGARFFTGEV